VNSTQKRIALAAGRRIIANNLPVVGEAVCRMETQMRNSLTNMKLTVLTFLLALVGMAACAETATVGVLTMEIPAGFKMEVKHEKDSLGDLELNRWRAEDGRIIEILYYAGDPKQDRGPMVIAKEEPIEVVGQKTKLMETEVFLGATKKVLVVHLRFGDSTYIIDSERMSKGEFKGLLKNVKLVTKEANKRIGCQSPTG
jgi:hypothetical protein